MRKMIGCCKQFVFSSFSKFLCTIVLLVSITNVGRGQQVIGNYPSMNGGFEGATIDNTVFASAQAGKWVKNNLSQTIGSEITTVRSGSTSLSATNSSTTGRRIWTPLVTVTSFTSSVTIQYYRRVSNTTNTQQSQSGIGNGTTGIENQSGGYTVPSAANTWEKVTYTRGSNTYTDIAGVLFTSQTGSGGTMFIDDMVMYNGSVDNTVPNTPDAAFTSNATTSSLDVSWGAASGGVDGGGYVVVRYASAPNANNDPNQNGIYAIGNTITNGTGALVGTIRYIGTGTSFTDNVGLSQGTIYYYKIYTVDKAFNYSAETSCNGTTTLPSKTLAAVTLSSSLSTTYGTASAGVSFTASGTNLTENITATAQTGYQVSTDDITYSGSVSVSSGSTVYVRFSATQNAGTYNGATSVVLSSTGASDANVTTSAADNIVSKRNLTVTDAAANNKIYDGTNAATITGTLSGIVGADDVTLTGAGTFAQTNVGTGIVVTSACTLGGTKAGNYTLTQPSGLSANITQRSLTITANDVAKAPGVLLTGGTGSTAFTSSGLAGAETVGTVTITYGSAGATTGDGNTVGIYSNQVTPSSATGGTFNPANYTITYIGGSINVTLNEIGDYRTRSTMPGNVGNWGVNTSWEKWDGSNWIACSVGDFPDIGTASVTIRSGHTIDNDDDGIGTTLWDVKNLTVESGAKLWDNAFVSSNSYIQVYGNIICNGTIGDPLGDDISFDIVGGANCTISGTGSFTATRIRKDANINPDLNTTLTIDMDIRLTWSSVSGVVLFNDASSSSNFDITVNPGKTLRCFGPGPIACNVSIDGTNGNASPNSGGTYTIFGTMDVDGALVSLNNNLVNGTTVIVKNNGILKCRFIQTGESGAAGNTLRVESGGTLNIFGSVDTVASANQTTWNNFSSTNNNWDFQPGSTLEYSGKTLQSVNGITQCSNFTVSGGGAKTLANPFTVGGTLTLTNGLVNTSLTNLLTLIAGASSTSGSDASFINGPIKKIGNTAFSFPVGKPVQNITPSVYNPAGLTGGWRPILISAPGNIADAFTAEFMHFSANLIGTITSPGLQGVSACEYWGLKRESSTEVDVSLTWKQKSICTPAAYVANATPVVVAVSSNGTPKTHTSGNWTNHGGGGSFTNPPYEGTSTWSQVSAAYYKDPSLTNYLGFTPFTLGTTNWQQAPLPYTLSTFKATAKDKVVQLDWQVVHNDRVRSYTVERSKDGVRFAPLKIVAARVNEQNASYIDNDPAPFKGWGYYRLRITDFDGNSTYSAIQKVWMGNAPVVQVSPNPVKDQLFINTANMAVKEISLINYLGQTLLRTIPISSNTMLDLSKFNAGVYYVRILTNEGVLTEQVIKQ